MFSKTSHFLFLRRTALAVGIVCLVTTFVVFVAAEKGDPQSSADTSTNTLASLRDAASKARIAEGFGRLPLSFERNAGQTDQAVKFLSRGPGYELFLTATDAVLTLRKPQPVKADELKRPSTNSASAANIREGSVLRLKMIGASAAPQVEGEDELPGKVNYLTGNDQQKWQRNVPTFRRVHYKDVYPGIDVVYYGNSQRELEYDLVIAAGANPQLIGFTVEGAEGMRLDKTGNLLLKLKHGELSLNKPVIYQLNEAGERRDLKGAYVINRNEIRFKVQGYDNQKPLVIDPILSYSTYLGSGSNDFALGIAVDSQGSAYVTGTTNGATFPTTVGAFKATSQLGGAFVTKLDPTGSSLVYSTYLAGNSDGSSVGTSIAVDAAGNAHVAGYTFTTDFPTVNALKTTSNFFKTTDSAASWTNRNSGLANDVTAIAVAPNSPNTIYAGTTNGIYRSTDGGTTWTRAPLTGTSGFPSVLSLAVDPSNSAVVYAGFRTGGLFKTTDGGNTMTAIMTQPLNFTGTFSIVFDPTTPSTIYAATSSGVFKSTNSGTTWTSQNSFGLANAPNVHALAIDPTATSTIYAGTLSNGLFKSTNGGGTWTAMNSGMGGNSPLSITAIAIDPANSAIIYTGHFSGTVNKTVNGGTLWAPVANGVPAFTVNSLVVSASAVYAATGGGGVVKTVNGGTNWTQVNIGLGSFNVNALAGRPSDTTTLYVGTATSFSRDAFVSKLNSSGSGLLFSTLLGGSGEDLGNGVAVDSNGNIIVVGETNSNNLPTVNAALAVAPSPDNCSNGFVAKLDPAAPGYVFSTYLGGNGCDVANAVAVDTSGNAYVTGKTTAMNFPLAGAMQNTLGDQFSGDAFVTKFSSNGSIGYSTFLGGDSSDIGNAIAVDSSGNAYVTGATTSSNFPTTNPIQPANGGANGDVFVAKLNSQGSTLVYSTYLGGSGLDIGRGIAVDATGNAYVTGFTESADFPLVQGSLRTKSAMYKSVDGATNWSNDNYGLKASSISQVVINPAQPSIVYAGTGNGVFKSVDSGRNWSAVNNGLNSKRVVGMVIDPATPATLYVATDDFGSNTNGIYKTTDAGDSWNLRSTGIGAATLLSLAIDPVAPATLYAGTYGGAVFKTTNGADNWAPAGAATPSFVVSLSVDPLNHNTIFAAADFSSGGVFKSVDGGSTWQELGFNQAGGGARSVFVSPLTAGLVYCNTLSGGLFRSTNGGANWSPVRQEMATIVFDPVTSSTVYALSATSGVLKSTDSGQTWVPVNKGLNDPVAVALAINPLKPSILHLVSAAAGGDDAFVTKINPAGNALVYSSLLGGTITNPGQSLVTGEGFAIALDATGNAYITGLAQSVNLPVTPNSYQPFNRGGSDAFIAKLSTSYTISGHVVDGVGAAVSDAEVVLNDGTSLISITTESDGSYVFSRLRAGGNYTVSATKPHFTMTPGSQTFNNLNSDRVLNFTTAASGASFVTISGKVTENGAGLAGVTITLSGAQSGLRTTDSNGNYSFELLAGANYTVTPSLLGFTFAPPNQSFLLNAAQVANFPASRQSFVVTNANNHGAGSLREAITNANATAGADTIVFNIPGPGIKTISLLTPLPDITDPVVIDATTQPGYAGTPLVELDGTLVSNSNGLLIKAGGTTVRGLAIGKFDVGIYVNGCDNNTIQATYIGVDATGTTARSNHTGIRLIGSNNLIGGAIAAARNVISGSTFAGLEIGGNNNIIQGNRIGTNAAGTIAIPNATGVSIPSSPWTNNLIGGTTAGAGNLISGNAKGIDTGGTGTIIQGNLIGTDAAGTSSVSNNTGINARGLNILVGGLTAAARNIISGNLGDGISIAGAGTKLQGNYIGTDITGALALGNGGSGVVAGDNVLIGGLVPEARNIIAANHGNGNVSLGSNNIGSAVTVQGNYIGTDVTGTRSLNDPMFFPGISISSNNNIVGGTVAGARNVISGNDSGIKIGDFSSLFSGNVIQGNYIGLNAAGTAALPNAREGILLSGAVNTTIGGTQPGAANKIAFNGAAGVSVEFGTGNAIRGNSIFSNVQLGIDLVVNNLTGVTPNDATDADTGPNNLQNFPVITSVLSNGGNTTIQGSLKSTPNTTFQIDFYSNSALDPSGNGEGALFFNTTSVNTDSNGNANINVTFPSALPTGRAITATATDPNGNTSEFSAGNAAAATGSVQFSLSGLQVLEDVGMAKITVVRTGGTLGAITVDYSTSDVTAVAGKDYTATSGTLTFAAGETTKTIQVPILQDAITEPDETFTVSLRNVSNPELVGGLSIFTVNIQDESTPLFLFLVNSWEVVEGDKGTTTDMFFTVYLSAATSQSVSVDYFTSNVNAFGGATCGTPGVDYQNAAGTLSFPAGASSVSFPVKICGDSSAEAIESFRVDIRNPVNATISISDGTGTILDDDELGLLLEQQASVANQAVALDALMGTRDPFKVAGIPDRFATSPDRNTRVLIFARGLQLNPGETASAVEITLIGGSNNAFFRITADDVRPIFEIPDALTARESEFTQVKFRLDSNMLPGTYNVTISVHGRVSNVGTIRIVP